MDVIWQLTVKFFRPSYSGDLVYHDNILLTYIRQIHKRTNTVFNTSNGYYNHKTTNGYCCKRCIVWIMKHDKSMHVVIKLSKIYNIPTGEALHSPFQQFGWTYSSCSWQSFTQVPWTGVDFQFCSSWGKTSQVVHRVFVPAFISDKGTAEGLENFHFSCKNIAGVIRIAPYFFVYEHAESAPWTSP